MADDLMIICRCEEVSLGQIEAALCEGACTVHAVKLATRAGMGICQGRTCRGLVERLVEDGGQRAHGSRPATVRMPVRPVPLSRFASGEGEL